MSAADTGSLRSRLWASRWPEVAWAAFAAGNLAWMVLTPGWSMLPFHFIWISLVLLYGVGYRTASRTLTWWLLVPVMAGAALIFADDRIRATAPYDELIELPVMVVLFFAITRLTNRRKVAMAALEEMAQRNAALLERQRVFVQNASHQIRTPITVAMAHAELWHQADGEAASGDDAAIVVDELSRLQRLVDQLLLLATAERSYSLSLTPVKLATLLDHSLRRWEPTPRRWLAGRRDNVVVLADSEQLVLALDAIIENAVRFTSNGDPIELSVRRHGQEAAITVADSGTGIPESQLTAVFDRFSGTGGQRSGRHNFGLGLSIVQAVAEARGGRVTADRGTLGGAAVTIWLPLHNPLEATVPVDGSHTGSDKANSLG